jgi:hypothetical protein
MFAASQVALFYTVKYMMKHLESGGSDPERQKQLEKGNKTLERLGLNGGDLDEYEREPPPLPLPVAIRLTVPCRNHRIRNHLTSRYPNNFL